MRNLIGDFRFGLRILLAQSGVHPRPQSVVLALGIGANTAIFSIVNGVLLRALPYQDASRIMQIGHVPPAKSFPGNVVVFGSPRPTTLMAGTEPFLEQMAAYGFDSFNVGGRASRSHQGIERRARILFDPARAAGFLAAPSPMTKTVRVRETS